MLLRRHIEHLRTQNWFAIALDLAVVVVGIFIAFQVDRWYDMQRLQSSLEDRLVALTQDFAGNRQAYTQAIETSDLALDAATRLLVYDENNPFDLDHDEFYSLLAAVSVSTYPRPIRRAYDALVATCEIELIRDSALQIELASFYAASEELDSYGEGAMLTDRLTFDTYVIRELDLVEMVRKVHPDGSSHLKGSSTGQDLNQITSTREFKGTIGAMWHVAHDFRRRNVEALKRIDRIEELLEQNLGSKASARD